MHKTPTRALQHIREEVRGKAVIRMSKKTLLLKALRASKKPGIEKIEERLTGEPALIMTNDNPFKIFKLLKESRTPAAAKIGDMPAADITIQKGPTSLPPGPSIATLQKVGLKTSVQGGKIAVMADKVVCKAGEKVTSELADVLSLLKIEPMEVGLDLACVWEDGTVYGRDVLDVSQEEYINDLTRCVQGAVNLSINIGYPTKLTAPLMVQKAFMEAKSLAMQADILEKDFIGDVLAKAERAAKSLESKM